MIPKGIKVRRLHKAFLRYHDPENWPVLRDALKRMGRADLIGNGKQHLIPAYQPRRAERAVARPARCRFAPSTRDCRKSGREASAPAQAPRQSLKRERNRLLALPAVRLKFRAV